MNPFIEVILKLAKLNGMTQSDIAKKWGVNKSFITNMKSFKSMNTDNFLELVKICGGEVIVRDRITGAEFRVDDK